MKVHPTTPDAFRLLMEGSLVLAQIEHNGFRIDVDYLKRAIEDAGKKIKEQELLLREDKTYEVWRKRFGVDTNLGSGDQLAHVLYKELGFKPQAFTETGKPKVDETALSLIDLPFAKEYVQLKKLEKIKTTYLGGILREAVDGFLHPSYQLHSVVSGRSSCVAPNGQNFPVRNKELARIVRTAFIARKGRQLVEIDYSAIEVRMSCPYHQDPTLTKYVKDPTTDMHRDTAMECFLLSKEQVSKDSRYVAKNMFVFPEFYGSYYLQCAENMWKAIKKMNLKAGEIPLRKHLKEKGIPELGDCDPEKKPRPNTFESHLQKVEQIFWGERFKVYANWKKKWWENYLEQGAFNTLTGFRVEGLFKRNECINLPIQGDAFKCLLWSLIEIQKELPKRNIDALLSAQIHDCLIADVNPKHLEKFVALCKEVMTKKLLHCWKWINVPLDVEVEVCPIGGTWYDKEVVKM